MGAVTVIVPPAQHIMVIDMVVGTMVMVTSMAASGAAMAEPRGSVVEIKGLMFIIAGG